LHPFCVIIQGRRSGFLVFGGGLTYGHRLSIRYRTTIGTALLMGPGASLEFHATLGETPIEVFDHHHPDPGHQMPNQVIPHPFLPLTQSRRIGWGRIVLVDHRNEPLVDWGRNVLVDHRNESLEVGHLVEEGSAERYDSSETHHCSS